MRADAGRGDGAGFLADDDERVDAAGDEVVNLVVLLGGVLADGEENLDVGVFGLDLLLGEFGGRDDAARPAVVGRRQRYADLELGGGGSLGFGLWRLVLLPASGDSGDSEEC